MSKTRLKQLNLEKKMWCNVMRFCTWLKDLFKIVIRIAFLIRLTYKLRKDYHCMYHKTLHNTLGLIQNKIFGWVLKKSSREITNMNSVFIFILLRCAECMRRKQDKYIVCFQSLEVLWLQINLISFSFKPQSLKIWWFK